MYMTIREVVARKQNTDTNITQPWTRGMGTREEAIRIHTRPPKICREEIERESIYWNRAKHRGSNHNSQPQQEFMDSGVADPQKAYKEGGHEPQLSRNVSFIPQC